jgi:hypothetical protein
MITKTKKKVLIKNIFVNENEQQLLLLASSRVEPPWKTQLRDWRLASQKYKQWDCDGTRRLPKKVEEQRSIASSIELP